MNDHTAPQRHIDILLVSGGHGGFENIVNQSATYLADAGYHVRYIQLVSSGIHWACPQAEHLCFDMDKEQFNYDDARSLYAKTLREDHQKPSLILAAGWPFMIYVAKGASSDAGLPVPVVAWPHDDFRYYEEGGSGDAGLLRFADMCLAYSRQIADQAYSAFPEKAIYRIRYSFVPEKICYNEQRDSLSLACVCRLTEKKAIPILLYALERTKNPWGLVLVGEGEEEDALRGLVRELRLTNRVHFKGWCENPWEEVRDCRALVVSSIYEGGPLTILESLASGMPVISTPVGIAEEVLVDPVLGSVVPFGNPEALTAALDRLSDVPFTPETARLCREHALDYLPETALFDFKKKIDACVDCILLPQHFEPGKKDLYL